MNFPLTVMELKDSIPPLDSTVQKTVVIVFERLQERTDPRKASGDRSESTTQLIELVGILCLLLRGTDDDYRQR
jgi:hypothetical protein